MFHYLYKITNTINSKIYIGIHSTTNLNGGYMGSGILIARTIKKYGKDKFHKHILQTFETQQEMVEAEWVMVNEDFVKRTDTYNLRIGGVGGDTISLHPNKDDIISQTRSTNANKSPSEKLRINKLKSNKGKANGMFGSKRSGRDNPMHGKTHSKETRELISRQRKKNTSSPGYINPRRGVKLSREQKDAIGKRNSKEWKFIKSGETIILQNLEKYCRNHDLNPLCMSRVFRGLAKSHKGYINEQTALSSGEI